MKKGSKKKCTKGTKLKYLGGGDIELQNPDAQKLYNSAWSANPQYQPLQQVPQQGPVTTQYAPGPQGQQPMQLQGDPKMSDSYTASSYAWNPDPNGTFSPMSENYVPGANAEQPQGSQTAGKQRKGLTGGASINIDTTQITSGLLAGINGLLPYQKPKQNKNLLNYGPTTNNSGIANSRASFEYGGQLPMEEIVAVAKNGIHIDPKNKGKFNATKKATGKTTEELTHSKNPLTRKRAVFAQNAKKWNHAKDGMQITDEDRAQWEQMQTQAYQQGYQGNDHSKVPGWQFMQQNGLDPNRLQDFQQDFQNLSQTDPGRIHTGSELSKVDDIYGHRTSQQRYNKFEYNSQRVNPQTHQYETYNTINNGYQPLTTDQWDNKLAAQQSQIQPLAQNTSIPMSKQTPQQNGLLSKEQAISAKKARGKNPDNFYMAYGGNVPVMNNDGQLQVEDDQYQHLSPNSIQLQGPSHEQYTKGKEYDLPLSEIKRLKKLGYKLSY